MKALRLAVSVIAVGAAVGLWLASASLVGRMFSQGSPVQSAVVMTLAGAGVSTLCIYIANAARTFRNPDHGVSTYRIFVRVIDVAVLAGLVGALSQMGDATNEVGLGVMVLLLGAIAGVMRDRAGDDMSRFTLRGLRKTTAIICALCVPVLFAVPDLKVLTGNIVVGILTVAIVAVIAGALPTQRKASSRAGGPPSATRQRAVSAPKKVKAKRG